MTSREESYRQFKKHLRESEPVRWLVAQWLSQFGYAVWLAPLQYSEDPNEWKKFRDNGDIHVTMRIEVKGLSCHFTCREDWPFSPKFIVCAKHSFDDAVPKPYAYLILNKACTYAAIVFASSQDTWYVEPRTDNRNGRGGTQDYYLAPLDQVVFMPMQWMAEGPWMPGGLTNALA